MVKKVCLSIFTLILLLGFVSTSYAGVFSSKTLLEAEVRVIREKIAELAKTDPEKAYKKSVEFLHDLHTAPKYVLRFSKADRNSFKETLLRNEFYDSACRAGFYDAATNAIREASSIKKDANDSKLIAETNQKHVKQQDMFAKEQASLKKCNDIQEKKKSLAKQKEDILKNYKNKNNLSQADLNNLDARIKSIDSLIASQNKLLDAEQKRYDDMVKARGAEKIVLNEKQEKKIKSAKSDIEKSLKKYDKQEKENKEILARVVGNFYYPQQMQKYGNIDKMYDKMADLAKQKLALIVAANLKKELTKDYLDNLKAKMASIDAQIETLKKSVEKEKADLKAIKEALKNQGGEYSLIQKAAIALREAHPPKGFVQFNLFNKDMTNALAKLVDKFEVSWNGLEQRLADLAKLQQKILKLRQQLLKDFAKEPLTPEDLEAVKKIKSELDELLAKEAALFEDVQKSFVDAKEFFDLKKGEREKFNKLFNNVYDLNKQINESEPSFNDIFAKLLGNSGGSDGSSDTSDDENGSSAPDILTVASEIFKADVASSKVTFSDGVVTITDFFDASGKLIGSRIEVDNSIVWRDVAGNYRVRDNSESSEESASDDAPADATDDESVNTDPATEETPDIELPKKPSRRIIEDEDKLPVKEDPKDLLDTL